MKKLLAMLLAGVLLCMGAACFAGCDDDEFLDIKVLVYDAAFPDIILGEVKEGDTLRDDAVITLPYDGRDHIFIGKVQFPDGRIVDKDKFGFELVHVRRGGYTLEDENETLETTYMAGPRGRYTYRFLVDAEYSWGISRFYESITIQIV